MEQGLQGHAEETRIAHVLKRAPGPGGLHSVFDVPENMMWQFIIMGAMFICYMISATSGLDKGIKNLSNLNLIICFALMFYILFTGPTIAILETITLGIGDYLQHFILLQVQFLLQLLLLLMNAPLIRKHVLVVAIEGARAK